MCVKLHMSSVTTLNYIICVLSSCYAYSAAAGMDPGVMLQCLLNHMLDLSRQ